MALLINIMLLFFFFFSWHFFSRRDGRAFFNVACKPSCALCPSSSPLPPHRRFGVMSKLASENCQVRFDAASTSCMQRMLHDRVARSPTVSRQVRMRSSSCSTCATAYLYHLYSFRRLASLKPSIRTNRIQPTTSPSTRPIVVFRGLWLAE